MEDKRSLLKWGVMEFRLSYYSEFGLGPSCVRLLYCNMLATTATAVTSWGKSIGGDIIVNVVVLVRGEAAA